MLKDFISLIFPQNCINCQQSLISAEDYLCTPCKIDLPRTNDHKLESNDLHRKFVFEPKIKSATAFMYFHKGGIAQKLLHQLKYKGKKDLGILLGYWFAPNLSEMGTDVDFIIPVPLHKSKKRKRGFNQSECIAEGLSETLEKPVELNLVTRLVATQSQTRKSKVQRWRNLENVYSKVDRDLTGMSILIVDDVITTGATVGMLCDRLIEANAAAIHIACIARGK
ncbi:ComF family protein [Ekhidna sp.]|uniref:ComF family protein n=1 Tax=Ekhidna sp. TaxID=2608089 RepID=UPI00351482ED